MTPEAADISSPDATSEPVAASRMKRKPSVFVRRIPSLEEEEEEEKEEEEDDKKKSQAQDTSVSDGEYQCSPFAVSLAALMTNLLSCICHMHMKSEN